MTHLVPKASWWSRSSELYRALECPASTILPRVPDESGDAAKWGTEVHRFVQTGESTHRVEKWLADITRFPDALREKYWPGGHHEVALRMNEDGSCEMKTSGSDAEREAFLDGALVRGRADWIGESVVPHIVDVKTGRMPPTLRPSETPQLLFYAYCLLWELDEEPGVYLSFDHWPRYPKGVEPVRIGPDYVSRAQLSEWYCNKLLPAQNAAHRPNAVNDARPGAWCQYCRAAFYCPVSIDPGLVSSNQLQRGK